MAMLRAGEIDAMQISPDFVPEVEGIPGVRMKLMPGAATNVYLLGQYYPERETYDPTVAWALPDKDKARKVRHALSYAIDRQAIVDYTLDGLGENTYAVWCFEPWDTQDSAWKPWPYDPDKALQLLEEAGYPDPSEIKVKMVLTQWMQTPNVKILEAIGMMWEDLGITVEYETQDVTQALTVTNARDAAGWVIGYVNPIHGQPAEYMHVTTHSGQWLGWGFEDKEWDALLDATLAEIDDAKRAELHRQLGQWIYDSQQVLSIVYVSVPMAMGSRIAEWPTTSVEPHALQGAEYIELAR